MKKKQVIIAIEGVDCTGKGTLAERITKLAAKQGYLAQHFTFPNHEEPYTRGFIQAYLSGDQHKTDNLAVFQTFCALNRKLTLADADPQADLLILDRFSMSSLAYRSALPFQGITKEQFQASWLHLEQKILLVPQPDLCLLFLLPINIIKQRLGRKNCDKHEKNPDYLAAVQEEYRLLALRPGQNWYLLPEEEKTRAQTANLAWEQIAPLLTAQNSSA